MTIDKITTTITGNKQEYDKILRDPSPTFSKVFQSSDNRNKVKYCPLCSKAGIESVVNDENVCQFCGDVGISYGISKDDELFVVNSIGGPPDGSSSESNNLAFGTFGGFEPLDQRKAAAPTNQKTLQQALKETELQT